MTVVAPELVKPNRPSREETWPVTPDEEATPRDELRRSVGPNMRLPLLRLNTFEGPTRQASHSRE
jgi:hypothetical protein